MTTPYSRHGSFPRRADLSGSIVEFVARQLGVEPGQLESYEWSGSTFDYHRSQIRAHLGFRTATVGDQEKLTQWLACNRLYRPSAGEPDAYPALTPALTRPIRWELIEQNYDQMIKYATAIRQRTASTEAILRRFTRSASHPAYQAMLEVGRAQRTIFVARYLRDRDLQREIHEGLNVVEAFNRANSVIYYGKGGEIASNSRDEQEMTVLCLRINAGPCPVVM